MSGILLDDRGFTLGHGLFETVLWAEGRLEHWQAHLERMARGCETIGLPPPDTEACRAAAEAALAAAGNPARAAVRLNWSAGRGGRGLDAPERPAPQLTASAAAVSPPDGPVTLATAQTRRNERSAASRIKSLSYHDNLLARAEARAAGADEALMLNTAGDIACAAAANVFWIRHGEVFTPALECGVLEGVMRGQVIAACRRLGIPVEAVAAPPGRLGGAPMFVTNSLIGVRPVARLDGRELPGSPLVAAIAEAVSSATR